MSSFKRIAPLAPFLAVACSGSGAFPPSGPSSSDIIGGVDAKGAALDAIGALMTGVQVPDAQAGGDAGAPARGTHTELQLRCTATLIAPTAIITAKHCVTPPTGPLHFATGFDTKQPKRVVPVVVSYAAEPLTGGVIGLGSDVAIAFLKDPITDIKPLKVREAPFGKADVGKKLTAVGYGVQNAAFDYGTRRAGTLTLRATEGNALEAEYGSFDAFAKKYQELEGLTDAPELRAQLQQIYDTTILQTGLEYFSGGADGDAQTCYGDSGGPLLERVDGERVVVGVASWVFSGTKAPCQIGAAHAAISPSALANVKHAISCADTSVAGRCEGTTAVRCVEPGEGPARITRVDCAVLDQECKIDPSGAACVDPAAGPQVDGAYVKDAAPGEPPSLMRFFAAGAFASVSAISVEVGVEALKTAKADGAWQLSGSTLSLAWAGVPQGTATLEPDGMRFDFNGMPTHWHFVRASF